MTANPQDEAANEIQEAASISGNSTTVDLDKVMSDIGIGRFHYQMIWIFGLGFSAVAIEVVLMAFLMPELRSHWHLDEYQLGLLASSSAVSSILGQLTWGAVADKYGRRFVFMSTVLVVSVFGGLSALSQTPLCLICLRCGVAFGIGGNISVDFSLFTEFMPTEGRGRMLLCMQAFWPLGQLITCLAAWWIIPGYGWRMFLVACMVPSLLTVAFRPFIPESPRWLVLNGHAEEATEVCRKMAIKNGHQPEDVGLKQGAIVDLPINSATPLVLDSSSMKNNKLTASGGSLAGKLFNKQLCCTSIGIIVFSSALHAVSYGNMTFLPSLLESKGITKANNYSFMVFNSIAEFPGVFCILALSGLLGRLMPMKVALLLISLIFLIFAMAQGTIAIFICVCVNSFFIESCWACYHTYLPEVYPTELRATATGFVNSVGCLVAALVPISAAFVLDRFGVDNVCMFFAGSALFGSIGAYLFLHVETHDRDLEDMVASRSEFAQKQPPHAVC